MASSFIGLSVEITLKPHTTSSATAVRGTVSSIDALSGLISLDQAVVSYAGGEQGEQYVGRKVLRRDQLLGLQVTGGVGPGSNAKGGHGAGQSQVRQTERQQQHESVSGTRRDHHESHGHDRTPVPVHNPYLGNETLGRAQASSLSTSARGSPARNGRQADRSTKKVIKKSQQQQQQQQSVGRRINEVQEIESYPGYTPTPPPAVPPTMDDDFDFSAGLAMLDKKKMWEHIRSQDSTDPSLRLVSHNRRSGTPGSSHGGGQTKLLPSESVLTAQELKQQANEQASALEHLALRHKPDIAPPSDSEQDWRADEQAEGDNEDYLPAPFGTEAGIVTPVVTLAQWQEATGIADIENGPSATLRTESAARGIASYILKKHCATGDGLGACILTSPLSLATAGRRGHKALIALRAAVTLANSGIRVLALVPQITNSSSPSDDGAAHQALRDAVRALSSSGARIVRDVRDLGSPRQTYNAVLDALIDDEILDDYGSDSSEQPVPPDITKSLMFLDHTDAPVIAINSAAGSDHDGQGSIFPRHTSPDCVISLGVLRPSATSFEREAALVLVDVGLSPLLWQRCGVEGVDARTFCGEFVQNVVRLQA